MYHQPLHISTSVRIRFIYTDRLAGMHTLSHRHHALLYGTFCLIRRLTAHAPQRAAVLVAERLVMQKLHLPNPHHRFQQTEPDSCFDRLKNF
jgi:hypothetical protein